MDFKKFKNVGLRQTLKILLDSSPPKASTTLFQNCVLSLMSFCTVGNIDAPPKEKSTAPKPSEKELMLGLGYSTSPVSNCKPK